MKHFDLNIDKILENWEAFHAIRELVANAIDEHILTSTETPKIFRVGNGWWHIRDFGRGLRYQDCRAMSHFFVKSCRTVALLSFSVGYSPPGIGMRFSPTR